MRNRFIDSLQPQGWMVQNSKTNQELEFSPQLKVEEAIVSAYAYFTMQDSDHTSHWAKYGSLLIKNGTTMICGDWTCSHSLTKKDTTDESPVLFSLAS